MPRAARKPLSERQVDWHRKGQLARRLLDEIDVSYIEQEAAEDIWRSLKKWGTPACHANHPIYCTCCDCT